MDFWLAYGEVLDAFIYFTLFVHFVRQSSDLLLDSLSLMPIQNM